jgi:hypothetical protein
MGDLIGPLTGDEWLSLRHVDTDDDILCCCANTSNLRDTLFDLLSRGAQAPCQELVDHWDIVEQHDLQHYPIFVKLHEYYVKGQKPTTPETLVRIMDMMTMSPETAGRLIDQAPHVWDLDTTAGRHRALHHLSSALCTTADQDRYRESILKVAGVTGTSPRLAHLLFDVLRAGRGLPVMTRDA